MPNHKYLRRIAPALAVLILPAAGWLGVIYYLANQESSACTGTPTAETADLFVSPGL